MDLQIAGRWAIVCASSQGLGYGCAQALAAEGVNLVLNARQEERLENAVKQLKNAYPNVNIKSLAGDISQSTTQKSVLALAPQVDILINNAGGPPPGDFRQWQAQDWQAALTANMITPIEMIKACVDNMAAQNFGRIVNITSSSVKAPIDVLGLSNGARSGLTGFVAGLARQTALASRNVTINNLLPGSFDTARLRNNMAVQAEQRQMTAEEMAAVRQKNIPAARFGNALEFGQFCAFLCSVQASYFTGQNVLLDGGAYPGTF